MSKTSHPLQKGNRGRWFAYSRRIPSKSAVIMDLTSFKIRQIIGDLRQHYPTFLPTQLQRSM